MTLIIDHPEADRLARELTEATGESGHRLPCRSRAFRVTRENRRSNVESRLRSPVAKHPRRHAKAAEGMIRWPPHIPST
ncbi:MAG TPA: type II toxin-antitoxin system VapB family antitoxin, partial [Longimicrobium sp.]|nr:type II toxin-antitoxin system VapB family antitoxin [Longimicrobium sp.]